MNFEVTKGNGTCAKIYLRAPIRKTVVKELEHKSVFAYRAEKANELMSEGDPVPAIIPNANVLRTARYEDESSNYLHKNPVQALKFMKDTSLKTVIHRIGLSPFVVHYSTNHQHEITRAYANREVSTWLIDATGSIVKPIVHENKLKSGAIFLYLVAISSPVEGQVSIFQMLSEEHRTNPLAFWLKDHTEKHGLSPPKEIICDGAKALLTAAIRAFTKNTTIYEYADACNASTIPSCYIRIDVAHFIKTYANLLKKSVAAVRRFYLASIGQLVLCDNVARAEKIITALLTLSQSEVANESSYCGTQKRYLFQVITSQATALFNATENKNDFNESPIVSQDTEPSMWGNWAAQINKSVQEKISQSEEQEANAYYLPQFAAKLLADIKMLPLWSCICTDKFGYGGKPASSAPVECEFKNLKTLLLGAEKLPMRVDKVLKIHVDHLNGIIKLAKAGQNKEVPEILKSSGDLQPENECADSPNFEKSPLPACPLCSKGDEPGGAHTCTICGKPVHALDFCSLAIDGEDEGYGQKRLCLQCHTQENVNDIIASQDFEDWGGQISAAQKPNKSKGIYLQNSYAQNALLLHLKFIDVPILKNGGDVQLKGVKNKRVVITLQNTCSFDSFFQLFLCASFDYQELADELANHQCNNNFLKMVMYVNRKGINRSAYKQRCDILCEIFEKTEPKLGCSSLLCNTTIGHISRQILKSHSPTFIERTICDQHCTNKQNTFAVLSVRLASLMHKSFNEEIIKDICLHSQKVCETAGCAGFVKKELSLQGNKSFNRNKFKFL